MNDDGNRWMSANTAYFTSLRAHPSHYWHWFYMKILCNVWDATESEIWPWLPLGFDGVLKVLILKNHRSRDSSSSCFSITFLIMNITS